MWLLVWQNSDLSWDPTSSMCGLGFVGHLRNHLLWFECHIKFVSLSLLCFTWIQLFNLHWNSIGSKDLSFVDIIFVPCYHRPRWCWIIHHFFSKSFTKLSIRIRGNWLFIKFIWVFIKSGQTLLLIRGYFKRRLAAFVLNKLASISLVFVISERPVMSVISPVWLPFGPFPKRLLFDRSTLWQLHDPFIFERGVKILLCSIRALRWPSFAVDPIHVHKIRGESSTRFVQSTG